MPNCDWGRPCDCRECRTQQRTEVCPQCGFKNVIELVGSAAWVVEDKGIGGYHVTYPSGPAMDLTCRKCHQIIHNVDFFTGIDEYACERQLQHDRVAAIAEKCSRCGESVEFKIEGYEPIELVDYNSERLCRGCHEKAVEKDTPDPSDRSRKFRFNRHTLKWEVHKIFTECAQCRKRYWVNSENAWKRLCLNCFKASRPSA